MLAEQKGTNAESLGPVLGWQIPLPDPVALADHWDQELSRHEITKAVIIDSVSGSVVTTATISLAQVARVFHSR